MTHRTMLKHLAKADPVLGECIARVGPFTLEPDTSRSPFHALVQAVAHQQLNGKAANTILSRFLALFPESPFPSPQEVLDLETDRLTAVGFSRAKASYIQEIARMALAGVVPDAIEIRRMPDDEIVARLTSVKGVGRWTVEMLLIFGLGRLDVLPAHDFGIRNGFKLLYRKRRLPEPKLILKHGERWRPYRSVASWYLWRVVDLASKSPQEGGGTTWP
ncbi:MAG: DNA-3-methyladenine glycosylase [Verrucomicrobiia bacterium]